MIRNDLKEKLPEGWREKFVHRDCDQANYEFAMFEINGKNKILVRNPDTDDIMEYYYDDFDGKISVSGFIESMGYKEQDRRKYYIDRDYNWYSIGDNGYLQKINLLETKNNLTVSGYVFKQVSLVNSSRSLLIHRIVGYLFVPNPYPDKQTIINHKDCNRQNFSKDNLEWSDYHTNNLKENKVSTLRLHTNLVQDYLSRHPIDPNGWYDDNGLHDFGKHKVRANSCGVLEVDGKITVGAKHINYYRLYICGKSILVHRLIYEIVSKTILGEGEIIDHINPVTEKDCNNEFLNLRRGTQKDNMNNTITKEALSKPVLQYDLFGNLVKRYTSMDQAARSVGLVSTGRVSGFITEDTDLVCKNFFFSSTEIDSKYERLNYIYYRWNPLTLKCECSGKTFKKVYSKQIPQSSAWNISKKYLNTGMPAPDGYYYQQGDPWNMLYDPENKDLTKKREEIHWKDRNKNREDD